jgi:flagellar hook protein FlgE
MTLNAPGQLGAGGIASNSLEASTVDLAGEFTNMIRFQRAYSASSKIITTVDDMLREVSDLKR